MRIVHTSDWHLGRKLGRVDRTEDLRRAVQQIADICNNERADVLLICGDLFEQGRADVLRYWIDQLNQILGSFLRGGGTVLAITGNHDNENFAQMLRQAMTLAAPAPSEMGGPVAHGRFYLFTGPTFFHLTDHDGCKVQFVALPSPTHSRYLKADEAQAYQGVDERNRALKTAYVSTLQGIFAHPKFDKTCPTVLAAHILTSGAEVRNGVKLTDGEGIVMRDAELPTHLAYVALGDIHKPQSILNLNHVRYCGSLDRMDVGESGEEKGVIVVDIGREGRIGDPRWMPIASTPIYYVEINEPATEVPELIEKYADHEHALVKLMLRYRAGRDDLNGLLAELERIFPRCYDRDWQEISGGENNGDGVGAGSHQNHTVRQTVMEYLQGQLDGDTEREEIFRLAEELVTQHERQ